MRFKFLFFFCLISILFPSLLHAEATILGSEKKVIQVQPEASTGLDIIFVVFDSSGCSLNFTGINGYAAKVSRFSNLGGGYAEELKEVSRNSTGLSFELNTQDMGYMIEEGSTRFYCWIVNYALHNMSLSKVIPADDQECDYSVLSITGSAPAITYYTINGQPRILSREIYVEYDTQEFDEESLNYRKIPEKKIYESIAGSQLTVSPPAYCPSYFTVSGDRFLREWDMSLSVESELVQPVAVDCHTEAVQEDLSGDEGSNVINGEGSNLGGSAPASISFIAYTTDGVIHYEWQMSRNQDFENPEYRFYQQDLDYTFSEEGTFYLRFIGSNAEGTCETFSDIYTVSIGASALECPNAFSPNDDGVNDVWKVSYRSLIDFHCEIFNRNGQKIFSFDDPSQGWDGTWHGKKVKSGVYYYVISATGADGEKYKKSGDINIINSVYYNNGQSSQPEL